MKQLSRELKPWVLASAIAAMSLAVGLVGVWLVVQLGESQRDDRVPVVVHGNHSTIKPPEARPGPPVPQRELPGYPIERWRKLQEAAGK